MSDIDRFSGKAREIWETVVQGDVPADGARLLIAAALREVHDAVIEAAAGLVASRIKGHTAEELIRAVRALKVSR